MNSRVDAIEKIDWYAMRWKIETFHKNLKSGCKAEESQLRTASRLTNLIAIFCILAWRVFWLTEINRSAPEAPPGVALTETEVTLLDQLIKDTARTAQAPALSRSLIKLAQLGGYLARANDPPPSLRWIEGYERIAEIASRLPHTRLVYVADREADILSLMRRAHELGTPAHWMIRAQHDRSLAGGEKLWQTVAAGAVVGEIQFTMAARHGQKARLVKQEIRAQRVDLPAGKAGAISVTCLMAREVDAPKGVKPVEWRLLSNREAMELPQ